MKRILFDQCVPVPLRDALVAVGIVETAYERGWATLKNGDLVEMASLNFDVLVTTDKNLRYQQNLTNRKISIVVLGNSTWRFVRLHLDRVILAVDLAGAGSFAEVDIPLPPKKPFTRL